MVEPRARETSFPLLSPNKPSPLYVGPLRVPHLELATIRTLQCASVDAAHLELAALTAV